MSKAKINIHYFAQPSRFIKLIDRVLPIISWFFIILLSIGLYFALWASPADYQQLDTVRIMYIHVPAAWMAIFIYSIMTAHALISLIWRHILADIVVKSCSQIGLMFTFICLTTGSIWGRPMWGTWWAWDARLTSVLLLLFIYIAICLIYNSFNKRDTGFKAANIFVLFGSFNIPIIKWSVDWWNTLHQPASIMKLSKPSIHPEMLTPLIFMACAFLCFFIMLFCIKVKDEVFRRKILILKEKIHIGKL